MGFPCPGPEGPETSSREQEQAGRLTAGVALCGPGRTLAPTPGATPSYHEPPRLSPLEGSRSPGHHRLLPRPGC